MITTLPPSFPPTGHVFCEQAITKNTAHPFCIRQYASFQDRLHLYFLFDLMSGGDLMDVLVAEAQVIKLRMRGSGIKDGCMGKKASGCYIWLYS